MQQYLNPFATLGVLPNLGASLVCAANPDLCEMQDYQEMKKYVVPAYFAKANLFLAGSTLNDEEFQNWLSQKNIKQYENKSLAEIIDCLKLSITPSVGSANPHNFLAVFYYLFLFLHNQLDSSSSSELALRNLKTLEEKIAEQQKVESSAHDDAVIVYNQEIISSQVALILQNVRHYFIQKMPAVLWCGLSFRDYLLHLPAPSQAEESYKKYVQALAQLIDTLLSEVFRDKKDDAQVSRLSLLINNINNLLLDSHCDANNQSNAQDWLLDKLQDKFCIDVPGSVNNVLRDLLVVKESRNALTDYMRQGHINVNEVSAFQRVIDPILLLEDFAYHWRDPSSSLLKAKNIVISVGNFYNGFAAAVSNAMYAVYRKFNPVVSYETALMDADRFAFFQQYFTEEQRYFSQLDGFLSGGALSDDEFKRFLSLLFCSNIQDGEQEIEGESIELVADAIDATIRAQCNELFAKNLAVLAKDIYKASLNMPENASYATTLKFLRSWYVYKYKIYITQANVAHAEVDKDFFRVINDVSAILHKLSKEVSTHEHNLVQDFEKLLASFNVAAANPLELYVFYALQEQYKQAASKDQSDESKRTFIVDMVRFFSSYLEENKKEDEELSLLQQLQGLPFNTKARDVLNFVQRNLLGKELQQLAQQSLLKLYQEQYKSALEEKIDNSSTVLMPQADVRQDVLDQQRRLYAILNSQDVCNTHFLTAKIINPALRYRMSEDFPTLLKNIDSYRLVFAHTLSNEEVSSEDIVFQATPKMIMYQCAKRIMTTGIRLFKAEIVKRRDFLSEMRQEGEVALLKLINASYTIYNSLDALLTDEKIAKICAVFVMHERELSVTSIIRKFNLHTLCAKWLLNYMLDSGNNSMDIAAAHLLTDELHDLRNALNAYQAAHNELSADLPFILSQQLLIQNIVYEAKKSFFQQSNVIEYSSAIGYYFDSILLKYVAIDVAHRFRSALVESPGAQVNTVSTEQRTYRFNQLYAHLKDVPGSVVINVDFMSKCQSLFGEGSYDLADELVAAMGNMIYLKGLQDRYQTLDTVENTLATFKTLSHDADASIERYLLQRLTTQIEAESDTLPHFKAIFDQINQDAQCNSRLLDIQNEQKVKDLVWRKYSEFKAKFQESVKKATDKYRQVGYLGSREIFCQIKQWRAYRDLAAHITSFIYYGIEVGSIVAGVAFAVMQHASIITALSALVIPHGLIPLATAFALAFICNLGKNLVRKYRAEKTTHGFWKCIWISLKEILVNQFTHVIFHPWYSLKKAVTGVASFIVRMWLRRFTEEELCSLEQYPDSEINEARAQEMINVCFELPATPAQHCGILYALKQNGIARYALAPAAEEAGVLPAVVGSASSAAAPKMGGAAAGVATAATHALGITF